MSKLIMKAKSKYGNKKSDSFDGFKFDSKWERDCYTKLKYMQLAGEIKTLRCQVRYNLHVSGILVAAYVADFVVEKKDGTEVVLDAKGVSTDVFRLKKKLMMAVHGIEVVLLKAKDKENHPWLCW